MAIQSLAKADSWIRSLKEALTLRSAGAASGRVDTVRDAKDSNNAPYLVLSDGGTETAGNPVILIRITQIDAVSKDIFGNSANAYSPHLCELAYEKDSTEAEPSRLDIEMVMFELAKLGIRIQVKEIADGTAVTAANTDAATVAADFDWLYWPTKGM